ncbi:MAG: VWA domain-containing protein [Litoreibacter sp.]|nr:VWA domain-containing protein [Litoreibacter sp.]
MKFLPIALFAASLSLSSPVAAQDRPELIEGKSSLYQRVLVRDRVPGRDGPDGAEVETVAPLQTLYVYKRDGAWIQVGRDDRGSDKFWLPTDATVDWNQNIVVTFEASENLGRVLFFNDIDDVYDLVESEDSAPGALALRQEAEAAEENDTSSEKILALGPRETVDLKRNLYVMPIIEAEEATMEAGPDINLLRVAVARADAGSGAPPAPSGDPDDFKAGIVFVVDTTISMGPYIRATRSVLEGIYNDIAQSGMADVVSFGLVGYRDNLDAAPQLGYDVETFVTLEQGSAAGAFLEGIDRMEEAQTPSKNFREDSFAGIEHAINSFDWSGYGSRLIVLVTDAGPRLASDPLSKTKMSATGLNAQVKERLEGSIAALHLRTNRGSNDHQTAETAYRLLTAEPNQSPLYYGVDQGDLNEFTQVASEFAQLITDQVIRFRQGGANEDFSRKRGEDDAGGSDFSRAVAQAGRTMQLRYLGRQKGTEAPDVFEAWVADRDFERNSLKPLSIRLLLSKNQLSDLDEALKIIIEQQEENILDPTEFFAQVLGAASDASRDPDKVSRRADLSLAQAVSIDEYLDGLPYKSRIMAVTEDDWIKMSTSEQLDLTNELYDKIERYRRYNEATDLWVDYLGAGPGGENLLYPMLLNDLP